MSKIQTNLSKMTVEEVNAFALDVITKMTGNTHFPTPNPTLVVAQAALDNSTAKTAAYIAHKQTTEQKLTERDNAVEALRTVVENLAGYVQTASGGDAAIIASAGYSVRVPPTPIGPLPAPEMVRAYVNDDEGVVQLHWSRVHGANSYQLEHTLNPNDPTSWVNHTSATRTDTTFTGLPSGQRMWFRARALGAAGPGVWSDPTVKMVP